METSPPALSAVESRESRLPVLIALADGSYFPISSVGNWNDGSMTRAHRRAINQAHNGRQGLSVWILSHAGYSTLCRYINSSNLQPCQGELAQQTNDTPGARQVQSVGISTVAETTRYFRPAAGHITNVPVVCTVASGHAGITTDRTTHRPIRRINHKSKERLNVAPNLEGGGSHEGIHGVIRLCHLLEGDQTLRVGNWKRK